LAGLSIIFVPPVALIVNVVGLFKPESRKVALVGLFISILQLCFLAFLIKGQC
jgi:hypothetical protein